MASMWLVMYSKPIAKNSIATIMGAAHNTSMWPLKMCPPPIFADGGGPARGGVISGGPP